METDIIEKLMPLFPFIFAVFYFGAERMEHKVMFGIFTAASSLFMSFEIAVDFNWLSLIYFFMGIGMALLLIVEYEKVMKGGDKK